jgi:hypothetical protein
MQKKRIEVLTFDGCPNATASGPSTIPAEDWPRAALSELS